MTSPRDRRSHPSFPPFPPSPSPSPSHPGPARRSGPRPISGSFLRAAGLVAVLGLAAFAAVGPAGALPPDPDPELSPCRVEGLDEEALCGTLEVPENPDLPDGRTIALNIMVLPATGPDPLPEPVVPFFGGPGEGVVGAAPFLAKNHPQVREVRDLLLIDIRGTGESNPLWCGYQAEHTYLERFMPFDGVARCAEELSGKADVTQYTTAHIVDDVDRVREALGYERLLVTGGSYGTRAAQVYMRRHPDHVLAAHLHGVVPPDDRMPQSFARDAQRALDGVIDECAIDAACRKAFPRLRAELWQVVEHLESGHTIPATVTDTETGDQVRIDLGRASFVHGLRYMLYRPNTAAQVPLAIHEAAAGDASIVAAVADAFDRGLSDAVSEGLYLSVTCAEDVPWIQPEDAIESARGTFVGELRYRIQTAACAVWPRGEVPADHLEPVRSEVPVLIVSGALDPVTPPEQGAEVARYLPNSLHLVIPHAAHDYGGLEGTDCLEEIETRFLRTASLEGLDTGCVSEIRRGSFALEPDAEAIELPSRAVARFVGRYRSEEMPELGIEMGDDGTLRARVPAQGSFRLVPVSETRFRIQGAPPGFVIEFRIEDGSVTGATLEQGSGASLEMVRVDGS